MISFKRLRNLRKVSFARHLITLPYHMMSSVSTGLFAGQIAVRLAGLAAAVAIGTTTALTTTGSLIVGIVGGIVGVIAITTGILGLASEHSKNTETLKTIIGSDSEPGQDYQLKCEVAKSLLHASQLDKKKLGELLFYLHGIEGRNLTEKLCNLFDVDYNKQYDSDGGKFQIPKGTTPQQLISEKIIELLNVDETELKNVRSRLLLNLIAAQASNDNYINHVKKELANLLNRSRVDSQGKKTFEYNKGDTKEFIEIISRLPGDNLNAKIACLYGIDPRYSVDLESLIKEIKFQEPPLVNEPRTQYENIRHLNRVIMKIAEEQYLSILLLKSQGTDRENATLKKEIEQFKKTLSLVEGDDYDQKIENIFNVGPFDRTATKFIERALKNEPIKEKTEADPTLISKLLNAKKEFDYDHSTVFFRPFSYMQDLFYAFSGSLTGFGIVTSIAAFVGVSIATSGAGLIVLLAAIGSAVLGFTIAYLVQRYTKNYSNSFKKETDATNELTQKATEKAKELNNEFQNRQILQPRPEPLESLPTRDLVHLPQYKLERRLQLQQERIEQLERQLQASQSANLQPKDDNASSPSQLTGSFFSSGQSPLEGQSADKNSEEPNKQFEQPSIGDKRPREKEPESPPPPAFKRTQGDNGNDGK